jgi:hypothetical protein
VLFSLETESLKLTLEAAVKSGAYLGDADLDGAYLRDLSARSKTAQKRSCDVASQTGS